MKSKTSRVFTIVLAGIFLLTGCGASSGTSILKDIKVERYVTLGDYQNLTVQVDAAEVDAQDWASFVSQLYNSNVTADNGGIVDRAVETGDTVNIDYVGKKDDVAFSGGTASGTDLTIGSGQFISGFEDGLIGVMPGETVDLNLTFPESYKNEELAGEDVVFTVTVNFIQPTEMSDEVVAGFGNANYSNVEELNQYAYDYLYSFALSSYENDVENSLIEELLNTSTFKELPEELLERYRASIETSVTESAAAYGLDVSTYTYYLYGMDEETFLDTYAERYTRQGLAFQAIANAEGLNLSDEELDQKLQDYATQAGYSSVEAFTGDLDKEEYREYFMFENVLQYLKDNAVVTND